MARSRSSSSSSSSSASFSSSSSSSESTWLGSDSDTETFSLSQLQSSALRRASYYPLGRKVFDIVDDWLDTAHTFVARHPHLQSICSQTLRLSAQHLPLQKLDKLANKTLDVVEYLVPSIKEPSVESQMPDIRGQPVTLDVYETAKAELDKLPDVRARLVEEIDRGCPDDHRLGEILVDLVWIGDRVHIAARKSGCKVEPLLNAHLRARYLGSRGGDHHVLAREALDCVDWLALLLRQVKRPVQAGQSDDRAEAGALDAGP